MKLELFKEYQEIFKKDHPFYFSERLKKWVNIPCPENELFNSFFINSKNKGNDVDLDKCGYILVKDKIFPKYSKLFKKTKMGKELIIFCHDKFNSGLKCHEGRLFKVKMTDYEYDNKNKGYFKFKILERIQEYLYYI